MTIDLFHGAHRQGLRLAILVSVIALTPCVSAQSNWGDRSFETTSTYDWNRRWEGSGGLSSNSRASDWEFGVTGDNSDIGFIVRGVDPNSAASRLGVARDDVIVCIGTDRVGQIGNQIYDFGEELNRHADSTGRVQMLVWQRRNGQLRSVNAQLERASSGLRGRLIIRDSWPPRDSVVTVRLENVSRPNYQVRNGEYSFRLPAYGVGEIPFELAFDPMYISPNDTYRLQAFVTSGGRTVFYAQQPPLVLTRGNPTNVDVVLTPATYYADRPQVDNGQYIPIDAYRSRIINAYRRFLGRMPTSVEVAAWEGYSDMFQRVDRLPLELMATDEYFNRSGGTDEAWMRNVFTEIVGHGPTTGELDSWLRRLADLRYSRGELLRQLDMQARG